MKKSGGQSHVRQGVAKWIIENVLLQMLPVRSAEKIIADPVPAEMYDTTPSKSVHGARLRWEPPKAKRPLKSHPFLSLQLKEMKRIRAARLAQQFVENQA